MIEGHGDDLYKYERPITANFSSNLTNWIDPAPLVAYLRENMGTAVATYPEPQPYSLEARLGEALGISPSQVCVTNGATEAIYLIAQSFAGSRSVVVQPTFSEYADACLMHGHGVSSLYTLPADGVLPPSVRLFWLCNPNNPTGLVAGKACVTRMANANPHVLFVFDQSYESFTMKPLLSAREAAELPNVLLLHSLTKRYAMPGLRLGYVTGAAAVLSGLRSRRMPWSVNGVAILAGLFLSGHPEAMPFDLAGCLDETARLQAVLRRTGNIDVGDTDTHFMLLRLRTGRAADLKEYLASEHGILIRDAANFDGLDSSYFRISTQRKDDNERLAAAVRQWFKR